MFEIYFRKSALSQYSKLSQPTQKRIKKVLTQLANDPFKIPFKKLINFENMLRVRIGSYKIIYSINKNSCIIEIIKIGKRENVYEFK
ncbi:MAG: type II toxin-antitoxin system RelE family toxin [Candidatus Woesearchaeota archaeon]